DLLDRAQIAPWLQFITTDRARQQHAADARCVHLRQQWFGDALRALDLVSGGFDRCAEFAHAWHGVEEGRCEVVHGALAAPAADTVNSMGRCRCTAPPYDVT